MFDDDVLEASNRFYLALVRLFSGELEPMVAVWSHATDVTNMGPFGGIQEGWEAVRAQFTREAGMRMGGGITPEHVLVRVKGDAAYTLCIERGQNMTAEGRPINVRQRATNIFRREDGQWKLVHHHTDISTALEQHAHEERD